MKSCLQLLLFILLIHLNSSVLGIGEDELIDIIWQIYKNSSFEAFTKYHLGIFKPLDGPYYRKLSELTNPIANNMAINGFPMGQPKGKHQALAYSPLKVNKIIWDGVSVLLLTKLLFNLLEGLRCSDTNQTSAFHNLMHKKCKCRLRCKFFLPLHVKFQE